jgi:hypothetical protein
MAMYKIKSADTSRLEVRRLVYRANDKVELADMDASLRKSVEEYTRRIAGKIAALENTEEGELTEDELDDEKEIASVGGMMF